MKSEGANSIPAVIAGKQVTINTDVVNSDIPLLLSRMTMKQTGVKMDLEHDRAEIFGQDVDLNITSFGHYCIRIDKTEKIPVETVCAVNLDDIGENERYKILPKLHRQFAHPSKRKLVALLKDAGVWKDDYLEVLTRIEESCMVCKSYTKTPPHPVVGLSMAHEFNEKVAMDLKQWKGQWILHMIDMWSRYTVSVFINRKRPSDIIDRMVTHWI